MLAFLVTGSTIASMAQQIVFATTWHRIKVVALEQAVASKHDPWIGTTPLSRGANLALYEGTNDVEDMMWQSRIIY